MGITSIVIDRPVSKVFARVSDLDRAREWAPQMGRIHLEGPIREGATFRRGAEGARPAAGAVRLSL